MGEMMFFIYIGNKLVEDHQADVMIWSQKQKGLAVYKDYIVLLPKNDA